MEHKNCPYQIVSSKSHQIGRIHVVQDRFLIDGKEYPFTYVINKDSVCIVPVYQNRIVLIHQYRHTLDEWRLEFPAGAMEEGESSRKAAERELLEETGFLAKEWFYMGRYDTNEGVACAKCDMYFARCDRKEQPACDKTEQIQTKLVTRQEMEELIERNEFKSLIGLAGWMQAIRRKLV